MEKSIESLADAEQNSAKIMNKELDFHLNSSEYAFNLLSFAINLVPEMKVSEVLNSMKVVVSLLVKISNDIRCASLLCTKGYSIQAASIVASMYESSFMVAYIGRDEERAIKWIEHDNPKKLFINTYDLTREAIIAFNIDNVSDLTQKEYLDYRQLCMVKHSNPLFQMQVGYQIEGSYILAVNGPDHSEESIRISWFVLEKSINYVLISLGSFINNHLQSKNNISELVKGYQELLEQHRNLNKLAVERWGTESPFPGKL